MRSRLTSGLCWAGVTETQSDMQSDLIMDVGMHDGTDTAYYLAKGFRVVAIEANPALVSAAQERFADAIARERLKIVAAAITESRGTTSMAVADSMTIWSSVDPGFIKRNTGIDYRQVEVPAIPFQDVLGEHGVPYFLKIDIEGNDILALRALHRMRDRPQFVSIESSVTAYKPDFADVFDELAELWTLGYRGFKYISQESLSRINLPRHPREGAYVAVTVKGHTSGPFGRETPGRWLTVHQALVRAELLRLRHNLTGYGGRWSDTRIGWMYATARQKVTGSQPPWYDLHARLSHEGG